MGSRLTRVRPSLDLRVVVRSRFIFSSPRDGSPAPCPLDPLNRLARGPFGHLSYWPPAIIAEGQFIARLYKVVFDCIRKR